MDGFDAEEWCESNLERPTKSAGDEWTAVCPACGKWSSFYVNPKKNGAYVCFACDFRGKTIVGLIAEVHGITRSEAAKYVFTHSVTLRRKDDLFTVGDRIRGLRERDRPAEAPDAVDYPLPKTFRPVWDAKRGWSFPTYLKDRKIKSATAKRWGLGYCRFGENVANRLIVPISCPNGESWTGRGMSKDMEPKYYNPPGADHGRLLIGWHVAKLTGDICLVEGPFDAIKFSQHGIDVLAVGGKVLHAEQLSMLFKLEKTQAVTVCLDPEERIAPFDVADQLSIHFERVFIARLPLGVDPGDSTKAQAVAALDGATRYKGSRMERAGERIRRGIAKGARVFSPS